MRYDAVIIGGGFYGCAVALFLKQQGYQNILLAEREPELMLRASYNNQGRVHNGYHYPRSFLTAFRSHVNFPKFCRDYAFAIKKDFINLYAIAAQRSKVTANQFERFMYDIGAAFQYAPAHYSHLFNPRLISTVYVTQEYAFDAVKLRHFFAAELAQAGCHLRLNTTAMHVAAEPPGIVVSLQNAQGETRVETGLVLNCTYANLNQLFPDTNARTPRKHEIVEIALVDPPEILHDTGVTVMDGPFFSLVPFPAESCHCLTHVRYSPQAHWMDNQLPSGAMLELDPLTLETRVYHMIADASRYLPSLKNLHYRRSLFEIKTILARNESDDGRPVLLRRESIHPRVFSILGGKIDNIYDVLEKLRETLAV